MGFGTARVRRALTVIYGLATLTRTTLSGNVCGTAISASSSNGGGAIITSLFSASLVLIDSTLSGNVALQGRSGGALRTNTRVTVVNSTFSGNIATGSGGAIMNDFGMGASTIVASSFVDNTAANGSSIAGNAAAVQVKNSLFQRAADGGRNCTGSPVDGGSNRQWPPGDPTCVGAFGDLQLGSLQDNGGPTFTHMPARTSAAVDAAADCNDLAGAAIAADQRGMPRPQGAACDIGAVERDDDPLFADGFE